MMENESDDENGRNLRKRTFAERGAVFGADENRSTLGQIAGTREALGAVLLAKAEVVNASSSQDPFQFDRARSSPEALEALRDRLLDLGKFEREKIAKALRGFQDSDDNGSMDVHVSNSHAWPLPRYNTALRREFVASVELRAKHRLPGELWQYVKVDLFPERHERVQMGLRRVVQILNGCYGSGVPYLSPLRCPYLYFCMGRWPSGPWTV